MDCAVAPLSSSLHQPVSELTVYADRKRLGDVLSVGGLVDNSYRTGYSGSHCADGSEDMSLRESLSDTVASGDYCTQSTLFGFPGSPGLPGLHHLPEVTK